MVVFAILPLYTNGQQSISLVDGNISNSIVDSTPFCNVEETDSVITVTYVFHHLNLLSDSVYPSTKMLRIKGFGFNHVQSQPEILMRWDAIRLPENMTGQVSVIDSSFIDIPMELAPARMNRKCRDVEYSICNVSPISSYSGFFPSYTIPNVKHLSYRDTPILHICVCPVKYNYETKTTRLYSKIQYRVNLVNSKETPKSTSVNRNKIVSKLLDNIVLNPKDDLRSVPQSYLMTEDYLIITTEKYRLAVERLAEWKRMLGFRVSVLYQNGWSPDCIRTYIRYFESVHPDLNYVLLIGGLNDVASFSYPNYPYSDYVSDYEYSCIDDDSFSDIYRGRLLVSTVNEAEIIVDKIINYERNPVMINSLYNQGTNGAVFEADESGYERTRAVLTSELINKVVVDSLQKNINFVYLRGDGAYPVHWNNTGLSYGNELPESVLNSIIWNGNAKKMMDNIDNGSFYVFYIGHGEWDKWYSLNLNKDSLDRLNNGIQHPVVFSMSCNTGDFTHTDCFAQHFCTMERKGGIAIFAATATAPFGSTEILGMDMIDAIWPNSLFNPIFPRGDNSVVSTPFPSYQLGQILNQGIYKMRMTWCYDDLYTSRIFHCFGDPSMRIYTEQPTSFENLSIIRDGSGIIVTTGETNAEISFCNKTSGEIIRYKGAACIYNCGTDEVSICVTGPNKIPYIDQIYLQNEEISGPIEYHGGIIKTGYSISDQKSYGEVKFCNGNITIKGKSIILDAGTTVELGTNLNVETGY